MNYNDERFRQTVAFARSEMFDDGIVSTHSIPGILILFRNVVFTAIDEVDRLNKIINELGSEYAIVCHFKNELERVNKDLYVAVEGNKSLQAHVKDLSRIIDGMSKR